MYVTTVIILEYNRIHSVKEQCEKLWRCSIALLYPQIRKKLQPFARYFIKNYTFRIYIHVSNNLYQVSWQI
jgi:hypothetical protein